MGSPFATATASIASPSGSGRYEGLIDESWTLMPHPQGGVVTAAAVRAMGAELGDDVQSLRSLHTTFVAPVSHGAVDIDVEILRRGRSMSQLRAEVRNPAAARGHTTDAVFGSPRRGFEFTGLAPPIGFVPLDQARSFWDPPPPGTEPFIPAPFWQHLEGRAALGHAPWEDYQPGPAENGTWYRIDEPPMLADGTLDPLALIVIADTMPGAVAEKLGPQQRHGWFGPSIDLTFHLLDSCRSEWVFAHNLARHAADGYASVDMALWDFGPDGKDEGRLVAYATQMCFFTFT